MIDIPQANVSRRPGDLHGDGAEEISACLRQLLADAFRFYMKTNNLHWHMTGRHFRDFHLLLDEQADQIFSITDEIAERARKIGGATLHSIGERAGCCPLLQFVVLRKREVDHTPAEQTCIYGIYART